MQLNFVRQFVCDRDIHIIYTIIILLDFSIDCVVYRSVCGFRSSVHNIICIMQAHLKYFKLFFFLIIILSGRFARMVYQIIVYKYLLNIVLLLWVGASKSLIRSATFKLPCCFSKYACANNNAHIIQHSASKWFLLKTAHGKSDLSDAINNRITRGR